MVFEAQQPDHTFDSNIILDFTVQNTKHLCQKIQEEFLLQASEQIPSIFDIDL